MIGWGRGGQSDWSYPSSLPLMLKELPWLPSVTSSWAQARQHQLHSLLKGGDSSSQARCGGDEERNGFWKQKWQCFPNTSSGWEGGVREMNWSNMQAPTACVGISDVTHTAEESELTPTDERKCVAVVFLCLSNLTENGWGTTFPEWLWRNNVLSMETLSHSSNSLRLSGNPVIWAPL